MRLLILFVCFSLYLECLSQDITEAGTQSSTEGTYTDNQGIDWDTTLSPSRTTVHGGRKGRYQQTSRTNLDYTTLFPNWGPMMMPIAAAPPRFGTRIQNTNAKEETKDTQDVNSNIRHSENFRENLTENVNQYPAPSSAVRNPLNAPYHPYPPMMFYPRPNERLEDLRYSIPNESANSAHPLRLQDLNENQNGSASSPAPFYYGMPNLPSARLDERVPFPFMGYPQPNFFLRNRADGRNFEGPVPFAPYAFPYGMYPPPPPAAIPPNDDGSQIYPEIDIFVRPPYVDREPGSDPLTAEEVLPRSDPSPLSEPVEPPTNPPSVEPIPSESLPRSSLPVNPFPFGLFPPGLAPPLPFPQSEIPLPTLPPQRYPEAPAPREDNAPQNVLAPAVPPNAFPPVVLPSDLPPIVPPSAFPPVIPPSALPPLAPAVAVDRLPETLPPPPSSSVDLLPPPEEAGAIPGVPGPPEDLPPVITSDRTPYEFGFDMNDGKGTDQHRQESADEAGVVTGSYGYRDVYGVYRLVNYIADKNGFRAFVQSNEPGVANPGSADVVVMAERPPPKTVADSLKPPQPTAVEVPEDLLVQASESKA
ncbi:cuticle protein 10.9 [Trichonephila clavata]|uniref:Cuticle protein 10.9 n=1 Tax=Trichonephila clavata TaxID=2740835 RepID=A0A8X6KBW5_TRICU|nr:cuticle protein 10.9 [Trichonephila clavata]